MIDKILLRYIGIVYTLTKGDCYEKYDLLYGTIDPKSAG